MALGTITKPTTGTGGAPNPDFTVSNKRWRTRDIQLTAGANYTTGGETITPSQVGLRSTIHQVIGTGVAAAAAGTTAWVVKYDHTNSKLQAFGSNGAAPAALAEAASNTNLSTFVVRLTFVGV